MAEYKVQLTIGAAVDSSLAASINQARTSIASLSAGGVAGVGRLGAATEQAGVQAAQMGQLGATAADLMRTQTATADVVVGKLGSTAETAGQKSAKALQLGETAAQKFGIRTEAAQGIVVKTGSAIDILTTRQERLGAAIRRFGDSGTQRVARLRTEYDRLGKTVESVIRRQQASASIRARIEGLDAMRGQLKGQIFETMALGATVAIPIKLAVNYESAMADVKKVTNFDAPGFTKFSRDILDLSTRIPIAADGLAQIAAAAGQAGIAESELLEFTETAAKMGVAFDISAAEAGDAMAGLKTNFNLKTLDEVRLLGDAFNYLGDKLGAPAAKLVEFSNRTAGVGTLYGMTGQQVGALGAAFIAMKMPAEKAATATSTLLMALGTADSATPKAEAAFKRLGLSAKSMADLMKKDGQAGLEKFLDTVSQSKDPIGALKDILGVGFTDEIAKLVSEGGIAKYKEALRRLNDPELAGAMDKEYKNRAETTANSFQLLKNNLERFAITIGSTVLPQVNQMVQSFRPVIDRVVLWAEKNPELVGTILKLGMALVGAKVAMLGVRFAFLTVASPILKTAEAVAKTREAWATFSAARAAGQYAWIGRASTAAGRAAMASGRAIGRAMSSAASAVMHPGQTIRGTMAGIGSAAIRAGQMSMIGGRMVGGGAVMMGQGAIRAGSMIGGAFMTLGRTLMAAGAMAMANPIVLIIGAVALGALLIYKYWDDIVPFFQVLWDRVGGFFEAGWEVIKFLFFNFSPLGLLIQHWEPITEFFGDLWDGIVDFFDGAWERIKSLFLDYTPLGLVISNWEPITEFFGELWDDVTGFFDDGWEGIKSSLTSFLPIDVIVEKWEPIAGFFGDLWDQVKAPFGAAWEWIKSLLMEYTPLGWIIENWDPIVAWFTDLWERVKAPFVAVWDFIGDKIGKVVDFASTIGKAIGGIGDSVSQWTTEFGQDYDKKKQEHLAKKAGATLGATTAQPVATTPAVATAQKSTTTKAVTASPTDVLKSQMASIPSMAGDIGKQSAEAFGGGFGSAVAIDASTLDSQLSSAASAAGLAGQQSAEAFSAGFASAATVDASTIVAQFDGLPPAIGEIGRHSAAAFEVKINAMPATCKGVRDTMLAQFRAVPTHMQSLGTSMVDGLIAGLRARQAALQAAASNVAKAASTGVTTAAQIKSPSRLFAGHGADMVQGLIVGIARRGPIVSKDMAALATDTAKAWQPGELPAPTIEATKAPIGPAANDDGALTRLGATISRAAATVIPPALMALSNAVAAMPATLPAQPAAHTPPFVVAAPVAQPVAPAAQTAQMPTSATQPSPRIPPLVAAQTAPRNDLSQLTGLIGRLAPDVAPITKAVLGQIAETQAAQPVAPAAPSQPAPQTKPTAPAQSATPPATIAAPPSASSMSTTVDQSSHRTPPLVACQAAPRNDLSQLTGLIGRLAPDAHPTNLIPRFAGAPDVAPITKEIFRQLSPSRAGERSSESKAAAPVDRAAVPTPLAAGKRPAGQGGQAITINFSPTINVTGGGNPAETRAAVEQTLPDLERLLDRALKRRDADSERRGYD